MERATFHKVGGWTDGLFHLDDSDIMMKLGVSGRYIQILSPPTTCYRVRAGNTVNQVAPFIPTMRALISKKKSGEYPGGSRFQFERYAFIGGPIVFWVGKCIRTRLFGSASSLLIHGWLMAMAAITRRLFGIVAEGEHFKRCKCSGRLRVASTRCIQKAMKVGCRRTAGPFEVLTV